MKQEAWRKEKEAESRRLRQERHALEEQTKALARLPTRKERTQVRYQRKTTGLRASHVLRSIAQHLSGLLDLIGLPNNATCEHSWLP